MQYSTGRGLTVLLTCWQLAPSVDGPLPSSSATALPCFKRGQCIQDCFPAESGMSMVLCSAAACKSGSMRYISIHCLSFRSSFKAAAWAAST